MKLLVYFPHFWLKELRGIHNDLNCTITQIRDKTTNATQDQIEFEGSRQNKIK